MTKHRSHDERREQILSAARACFIRAGYAHTRVDDIANEAGLSKGGIYFHFRSKREIFDALLDAQQSATAALLSEAAGASGTPAEKLSQLATLMMRLLSEAEDRRKFLIVLAEMGMRDETLMQRVQDAHARYVDAIAATLEAGVRDGTFRDIDARQAAVLLKMIIDGVEQALALGYPLDTTELLATGMDVLFRGLLRQDG
jgi:AcrR family transcriptional regulator